jgi:colicin import membrane protein
MADKTILYTVDVDGTQADTTLGEMADNTAKVNTSIKELKQQLRDTQNELTNLDPKSEAFTIAATKAGKLRDEIKEVTEATNVFAGGSKFEIFGNVIGDVSGKIKDLDFSGAAESANRLSSIKFNFGDATSSLKSLGSTFLSIGKSLLTNPLFLIGSVITAVIANFDKLKETIKPLGILVDAISGPVQSLIQNLKDLSDWLGLTSFAQDEATESTVTNAKKQIDAIEQRYDREIALASASGKDTFAIEQQKIKAVQNSISIQLEAYRAKYREQGKLNEDELKDFESLKKEQYKLETESLTNIQKENARVAAENKRKAEENARAAQAAAQATANDNKRLIKQVEDVRIQSIENIEEKERATALEAKKRRDDEIKSSKASQNIKLKALKSSEEQYNREINNITEKSNKLRIEKERETQKVLDNIDLLAIKDKNERLRTTAALEAERSIEEINRTEKDENLKALKIKEVQLRLKGELDKIDADIATEKLAADEKAKADKLAADDKAKADKKKADDDELAKEKEKQQARFEIANAFVENLSALNNLIAQSDEERVKKGELTEEEAKKRAFQRNKALSIVSAVNNGAQAVTQALASAPPPFNFVLAGLVGSAAALQIAAISNSKYDSKGGSTSSSPSSSIGSLSQGATQSGNNLRGLQTNANPSINRISTSIKNNGTTTTDSNGNVVNTPQSPIKVYVLESDISNTQNSVTKTNVKSTF